MKRTKRAFKILYSHRFPDGRSVSRTDYYETEDANMIDNLIRSQGAQELAEGAAPTSAPGALETQPELPQDPEVDPDTAGEDEPDWDYRTRSDMRRFLDACGLPQPSKNASKPAIVAECSAAWASNMRPSPFYGLPGGHAPAEGLPGPNAGDPQVLKDAIATAEAAEIEVPDETRLALDALLNPAEEEEAEADSDSGDDTSETEDSGDETTADAEDPESEDAETAPEDSTPEE